MRRPPSNDATPRPSGGHKRAATAADVGVQPLSVAPLTWRLDAIAKALGISRRAIERERAAGRVPPPDVTVGRMPLWCPETIRQWVERGGRP